MTAYRWLIFLAIATAIVAACHYYIWLRFVADARLDAPWRRVATVVLIVLAISQPSIFMVARALRGGPGWALVYGAYVWMGMMFLLVMVALAGDVGRMLVAIGQMVSDAGVIEPERREFLQRMRAVALAGVGGLVGISAWTIAQLPPAIVRVPVSLRRWPERLRGYKIVQLSDLHIGATMRRAYVEQVVARTNALKPDLVVITGDLIDGSVEQLADDVEPLADLRARDGVYFVTGNHEYYSGIDSWLQKVEALGMRVLANERVTVGGGDAAFDLAGVHDYSAARLGMGHTPDVDAALSGRDASREVVLLAHQPKHVHAAANHGVGLVLCGHTHAGQIWPFGYFVRLTQPYLEGLARHSPETQIYVNRGTGHWGPPMRFTKPSEITQLVLEPASEV